MAEKKHRRAIVREVSAPGERWEAYSALLQRYLASRIRKPDQIPDLTQEIFERFLRRKDRPECIRSPQAYLRGIASHVLYEAYEEQQRGLVEFDSELVSQAAESFPGHEEGLADRIGMQRDIIEALKALPKSHLLAILLVKGRGMSLEEASRETGLSVGTMKVYIWEARYKLKRILKDYAQRRESLE